MFFLEAVAFLSLCQPLLPVSDDADVVAELVSMLRDGDYDDQARAALRLGLRGDAARSAVPDLVDASRSDSVKVRFAADWALERITGRTEFLPARFDPADDTVTWYGWRIQAGGRYEVVAEGFSGLAVHDGQEPRVEMTISDADVTVRMVALPDRILYEVSETIDGRMQSRFFDSFYEMVAFHPKADACYENLRRHLARGMRASFRLEGPAVSTPSRRGLGGDQEDPTRY